MKKLMMPLLVCLFMFSFASTGFGDTYWRTYEVVAISDNSLTLVDSDNTQIEVNKDPKDYKVGYKVRYDDVRDVLKKNRWQNYTVRKVSSSSIILEHKTGDTLTLRSGDVKTQLGKFKKGDAVSYDSAGKHLKLNE